MSRNVNVNALLETIKSALDKLGATKALRQRVEALAKAAGADQHLDNKKKRKPSAKEDIKAAKKWRGTEAVKHAHKRPRSEDQEEPRLKRGQKPAKSKTSKKTERKASKKTERKARHTDDGNKKVVKHARLRAVKVKKTDASVETPSKVRENKKLAKSSVVKRGPRPQVLIHRLPSL